MQRLYRESHYANGTIESGERKSRSLSACRKKRERQTRTRRDGSREEGRKRAWRGAGDVTENALLIISPKGEELILRKKPQPNYSSWSSSDARWTTLRADFIGPLICNVNPRARKLQLHETSCVCILEPLLVLEKRKNWESYTSAICFKRAIRKFTKVT